MSQLQLEVVTPERRALSEAVNSVTIPGREGKYCKLEDTIKGFQEIIAGKHDDLPEQAFYMVGTIDEAIEAGKKME